MDTADKFIESLLASGKSLNDISQELGAAINRKQKELNKKREIYDALVANVETALETGEWTWHVAASAATLAAINQKIVTNKEDTDRFFGNALQILKGKVTIKREEDYSSKGLDEDWKKINKFLRRL